LCGLVAECLSKPFYASYLEGDALDKFLLSDAALRPGVSVFKTHLIGPRAAHLARSGIIKNICTLRDPRDCVASRQEFKSESLSDSIGLVRASYTTAMGLDDAALFLDFENIKTSPVSVILDMMEYLGIDFESADEVAGILSEEFSLEKMKKMEPNNGIDPLTEIHENHFHGGESGKGVSLGLDKKLEDLLDFYRKVTNDS